VQHDIDPPERTRIRAGGPEDAALLTVHQPCRDIAIAAFRALLERIAEPTLATRSILLASRLVVR